MMKRATRPAFWRPAAGRFTGGPTTDAYYGVAASSPAI